MNLHRIPCCGPYSSKHIHPRALDESDCCWHLLSDPPPHCNNKESNKISIMHAVPNRELIYFFFFSVTHNPRPIFHKLNFPIINVQLTSNLYTVFCWPYNEISCSKDFFLIQAVELNLNVAMLTKVKVC